jgi:hypothetical protein
LHRLKMKDALALLKTNMYILITRESTSLFGNFTGLDNDMKLHALKEARDEINNQIKIAEKSIRKENKEK